MNPCESGPLPEQCTDLFSAQSDEWIAFYRTKPQFSDRLALFVSNVRKHVPRSGRILDFGCGPGVLSMALAHDGYEVTGFDGSEGMIQAAKRESEGKGLSGVSFQVTSAELFSPEPERFDAIVCSSVLEYIQDDNRLLDGFARALRPGGILLISVPHTSSYCGRVQDFLSHIPGLLRGPGRKYLKHTRRRYDLQRFSEVLRERSLDIHKITFFEFPLLGRYSIRLSRLSQLGVMALAMAVKQ